jgi:hypothetical protein
MIGDKSFSGLGTKLDKYYYGSGRYGQERELLSRVTIHATYCGKPE